MKTRRDQEKRENTISCDLKIQNTHSKENKTAETICIRTFS